MCGEHVKFKANQFTVFYLYFYFTELSQYFMWHDMKVTLTDSWYTVTDSLTYCCQLTDCPKLKLVTDPRRNLLLVFSSLVALVTDSCLSTPGCTGPPSNTPVCEPGLWDSSDRTDNVLFLLLLLLLWGNTGFSFRLIGDIGSSREIFINFEKMKKDFDK